MPSGDTKITINWIYSGIPGRFLKDGLTRKKEKPQKFCVGTQRPMMPTENGHNLEPKKH
jgi:hypothetical protein